MLEDKEFELIEETPNTEEVVKEVKITDDDFTLTQVDSTVHEQKFQTKPTTFLKDSLKRFRKNKSSVVATYILGALLVMSFIVPLVDRSDTKKPHPAETYLSPKLFNAGTGWWDGTVTYENIAVDVSAKPDANTEEEKQQYWWPSKQNFPQHSAISKKVFTDEEYTNNLTSFGKDGYIQFGYYNNAEKDTVVDFASKRFTNLTIDNDLYLSVFDTYDVEKLEANENKDNVSIPENYVLGDSALYFHYTVTEIVDDVSMPVQKDLLLVDYSKTHNIGSAIASLAEPKVDIAKIINDETGLTNFENAYFSVRMVSEGLGHNTCSLLKSVVFESSSLDEETKNAFDAMSFTDPTSLMTKTSDNGYEYWSSTGVKRIFMSKAYFCSFTYDTYEAAFGEREVEGFSIFSLLDYEEKGWLSFKNNGIPTLMIDESIGGFYLDQTNFKCTILNPEKCPVTKEIQVSDFYDYDEETGRLSVKVTVSYYKFLGYDRMPRYLMGTDKSGRDMFKYVFEGLRTSLLLGVLTFIVCFLFGLLWGSICGYFGGTVDLLMERFTDILAGVPWIVVMTLIIIHMGSNFWTFALALCLTGWIGTAARTRTQFYRFRGREYVLASRTLGASDARLIVKHILPNALGTIITGAVLMIPSVIFSEATISYLGLGLKGMSSLGVILSDNQAELLTSSYLLIFPAIVIALIMISFNLFGNGLRDAINPSLKGEEE